MRGISLDSWLQDTTERRQASPALAARANMLLVVGVIALVVGFFLTGGVNAADRFWHAYLWAFYYFTSIGLGALFLVAIMHMTGAKWGVVIRRLAEVISMSLGMMALAFIPIIVVVMQRNGVLYEWSAWTPEVAKGNELLEKKILYLNPIFFTVRAVIYFAAWYFMARGFYRGSVRQDRAQTNAPMRPLRIWCGPALMVFALTISGAAFDWTMSLTPTWFSTMFGVYYFAGCAVAIFATLILLSNYLQNRGVLVRTITTEHYHDLSKLMFGYIVFWGYITFSQFMLIWYAYLPEETQWFAMRQEAPTAIGISVQTAVLFIGHLFIPFLGFMSKAIRRNRTIMAGWAIYMLLWHGYDLFYVISPSQLENKWAFGLPEILCFVGMGALFVSSALRHAAGQWLVPVRDPRLGASLAFVNT